MNGWCEEGIELGLGGIGEKVGALVGWKGCGDRLGVEGGHFGVEGLGSWWGGVDMVRGEEEVVGVVGCEEVGSDGCGDGFI